MNREKAAGVCLFTWEEEEEEEDEEAVMEYVLLI